MSCLLVLLYTIHPLVMDKWAYPTFNIILSTIYPDPLFNASLFILNERAFYLKKKNLTLVNVNVAKRALHLSIEEEANGLQGRN